MRTQDIRLDAGQSHFAWFDKGSQVIVLDGALAVTLRHGGLDWLPDAPQYVRRVLEEAPLAQAAVHVAVEELEDPPIEVAGLLPLHADFPPCRARAG